MEYLKIADFAEKAGVTVQAVYKRLKTDLEPFLKVEDGIKLINLEALSLFAVKQPVSKSSRELELEEKCASLQADKQQLLNELQELKSQLTEQQTAIFAVLNRQLELTENSQKLIASQQLLTKQLLEQSKPVELLNPVEPVEQPVKKPSLFKRLFSKS